ncbi:hypothetical protein POX_d05691 [Penicillium oxalicum]|uniref:hypothetical protein n=1 Tax=Penicillium oxalicum TaxID=69781 RepID=UPI0020B86B63|nr:hypothetical protein POX_d05691 [Penicillium oxalicum]KAI2790185.1 hypothetical protein POX_d05691 [Penicillium oxalicum]
MRSAMISSIFFLALLPIVTLALPIDPNDQSGQWDPSGQYRKGHYDAQGNFVPNESYIVLNNPSNNQELGWYQKGQYPGHENYNNGQYNNGLGWNDHRDGNKNDQFKNGQNQKQGANGLKTWPAGQSAQTQSGWTDANGVWHAHPTATQSGDSYESENKNRNQDQYNNAQDGCVNGKEWNERTGQRCSQSAIPVPSASAWAKVN